MATVLVRKYFMEMAGVKLEEKRSGTKIIEKLVLGVRGRSMSPQNKNKYTRCIGYVVPSQEWFHWFSIHKWYDQ